jgi:putative intracellular protease/amidase
MLEDQLKKRGTSYSKSKIPFRPYVKVDKRLVTGQNPQSPKQVVTKLLS